MDVERFELAPLPASDSGPPRIPIRKIDHTLNNDSLKNNNWQNSFNTIHTHYHYPANGSVYQRYRSTLPSTPEEQSCNPLITGQFPSLPTHETTQLQAADKSIDPQSQHTTPAISNHVSEVSVHQKSTFQAQHGRSKSQSLISRTFTRITRTLTRTTLNEKLQPKLYTTVVMENVAKYLPEGMNQKYKNYICSELFHSNVIPVFDPSTTRGEGIRKRVRIDVGDVGTFTIRGGFQVAFNILLDRKTNDLCGYDVPENFFPFVPRLNSEQRQKCYDDGDVINLDKCPAIATDYIDCRDPRSVGIEVTPVRSFLSRPSFEISPQAVKNNRRGFIHIPYATAPRYAFSGRSHSGMRLYLNEQLPNWFEYLDKVQEERRAPPIILISVWAARSFACAAYKSTPNTYSTLQLKAVSEERLEWTYAPEGCVTMLAPMADGYDEHDRPVSKVANQCFAIEGLGLLTKELEKSRTRR